MTPVLVLCILLCAASAVPAEKENLPVAAEFQQAKGPEGLSLCAEGWHVHSGVCYKVFTTSKTWVEAMEDCYSYGANLASTPSSWHYNFLQGISAAEGVGEAWLGGFYVQGIWMWVDELPFSYNGWGFRRSVPENDCVYLRSAGGWENSACSTSKNFICSKRSQC